MKGPFLPLNLSISHSGPIVLFRIRYSSKCRREDNHQNLIQSNQSLGVKVTKWKGVTAKISVRFSSTYTFLNHLAEGSASVIKMCMYYLPVVPSS